MRRRTHLAACLFFFLLFRGLLWSETFEVTVGRGVIRTGPGTSYDILSRVTRGEKFEIMERQGDWIKIQWLGREGWAHKDLGRAQGETRRSIGVVPSPARPAAGLYGQSFAVIVGINAYQNPSLRLHYAVNDAESVRAALRRLGFPDSNIIHLTDGQATGRAIRTAFNHLVQKTSDQDRVFFFFAGHGVTLDRPGGGQMGYLLPVEADPNNILGTGLPMSEARDLAGLLPAKHVFFAVDACFSGLLAARSVPRPETRVDPAYFTRGRLRQILTAGERDQPVLEEAGHGLFTKRLLEALEGEADASPRDGILTGMEIAAFVQGRVMAASSNRQTPFFGTMEGVGQFVFELPEAAPIPSPPIARAQAPSPRPGRPAPPPTGQAATGDVFVASEPAGAAIFLDGRDTGKKTPELLAGLPAGRHRLLLRRGKELGASRDVEVKARDLVNLHLPLERLLGELYAKVRPFGAEIFVDGKKLGETPLKLKVPAGVREVEIKKEGFQPLKRQMSVREGETADLTATLSEMPRGTLMVESSPPGAAILIDGKEMGQTPRALRLDARPHQVELRKPTRKSVTSTVLVEADRTNRVSYVLPEEGRTWKPEKLLTFVVPFAAGGPTDLLARITVSSLGKILGQPGVVINMPGAGGTVGGKFAAQARPDGYTLLFVSSTTDLVAPQTLKVPYEPLRDFAVIGRLTSSPFALVSRADRPWNTIQGFIDHAKRNPGKVTMGTWGTGSSSHLASLAFAQAARVQVRYVPFVGTMGVRTALIAGHVDAALLPAAMTQRAEFKGNLKILLISGKRPTDDPMFANVPTMSELGLGDGFTEERAIYVPRGIPPERLQALRSFLAELATKTSLQGELRKAGETIDFMDGASYEERRRRLWKEYGDLLREAEKRR